MLDAHLFNFFARTKALLNHTSAAQVFQARSHEGTPVSRADVVKFCYDPQFVIVAYNHTVTKIGCRCISQWNVLLSSSEMFIMNNTILLARPRRYWQAGRV